MSFRLIGDYTHRRESCCGAVYVATKETTDPTPEAANTNPNGDFAYSCASNRIVDVLQSLRQSRRLLRRPIRTTGR